MRSAVEDGQGFELVAHVLGEAAQREFEAGVEGVFAVAWVFAVEVGEDEAEVVGGGADAAVGEFAGEEDEGACVAVYGFDEFGDLFGVGAGVVRFGCESFLLHDLADEGDGVFARERAEGDLAARVVEGRGQGFACGEDEARVGAGVEELAAEVEEFVDGRGSDGLLAGLVGQDALQVVEDDDGGAVAERALDGLERALEVWEVGDRPGVAFGEELLSE
jgi:hypothetical protein